jgi:hypothetical protein
MKNKKAKRRTEGKNGRKSKREEAAAFAEA